MEKGMEQAPGLRKLLSQTREGIECSNASQSHQELLHVIRMKILLFTRSHINCLKLWPTSSSNILLNSSSALSQLPERRNTMNFSWSLITLQDISKYEDIELRPACPPSPLPGQQGLQPTSLTITTLSILAPCRDHKLYNIILYDCRIGEALATNFLLLDLA